MGMRTAAWKPSWRLSASEGAGNRVESWLSVANRPARAVRGVHETRICCIPWAKENGQQEKQGSQKKETTGSDTPNSGLGSRRGGYTDDTNKVKKTPEPLGYQLASQDRKCPDAKGKGKKRRRDGGGEEKEGK